MQYVNNEERPKILASLRAEPDLVAYRNKRFKVPRCADSNKESRNK